jgi:hypothetical protein
VQRFARFGEAEQQASAVSEPEDPFVVAEELAGLFGPVHVDADDMESLVEVLLDGIPPYEWDPDTPGGLARLTNYAAYLMQLPEYQLA